MDATFTPAIWATAGLAHAELTARRRAAQAPTRKRPVPDHLIGAHALHRADALLTRNVRDFSDLPALQVIEP